MSKKLITSIIAMALLIVVGVTALTSCTGGGGEIPELTGPGGSAFDHPEGDDSEEDDSVRFPANISMVTTEIESSEHVLLRALGPMTVADGVVSQTLTATVLPETAKNKLVDWSVSWADSSNTTPVTNYITVTPASAGSTTATVTCKGAFTGNIVVTVTTRESGYKADCIVSFVGIPTDLSISTSTPMKDATKYAMGVGGTYTFNVAPTNPFGVVGDGYKNVTATLGATGNVILGYCEKYSSGGTNWYDTSDKTVSLDSLKDNFVSISYANGVLTVNTIKSIESYCASTQKMDGGRTTAYYDKFRSYASDCSFYVTLTAPASGFTKTITFVFDDTIVAGVETDGEMQF